MTSTSGENGDPPRGASSAALKGALLIGLAIIVGLFLLQRADDDPSTTASTGTTKPPTATTTTAPRVTTTTTTVPSSPPKAPADLAVIVLNGGAASGKAKEMENALTAAGYTNQEPATNWDKKQTGNSVLCKADRQREAVALSQQTALQGSTIGAYPDPVPNPPVPADNDCIVVVGAAAAS